MANFRNLCACRQTGQAQILILKILQCIPAVKIFAFLDLAQIFSFMDGHYLKSILGIVKTMDNNAAAVSQSIGVPKWNRLFSGFKSWSWKFSTSTMSAQILMRNSFPFGISRTMGRARAKSGFLSGMDAGIMSSVLCRDQIQTPGLPGRACPRYPLGDDRFQGPIPWPCGIPRQEHRHQ